MSGPEEERPGPTMPRARRWFHYTIGHHLIGILRDGRIRTTRAGVAKGERPAVWFSCRETWEPTATKGIPLDPETGETGPTPSIAEMVSLFGPLVRIEVSETDARHPWADHIRMGNIDLRAADALASIAIEQGADPADWRISYHDVDHLLGIEASEDGQTWRSVLVTDHGKRSIDPEFLAKVRAAMATWERREATEK